MKQSIICIILLRIFEIMIKLMTKPKITSIMIKIMTITENKVSPFFAGIILLPNYFWIIGVIGQKEVNNNWKIKCFRYK